ncbi:MAG: prepilin-type N-terminal cleavage/methylation domain-containing protein [Actinomycetota bacterium]
MNRNNEDGFTLVELIIVIVIMGIVFGAITMAIITGLKTTTATDQRLSLSLDAEFASTWVTTDAQSATTIRTDATAPDGAPASCGPVVVRAGDGDDGLVARFDWAEADGTIHKVVSYVLSAPAASERVLTRYQCTDSTTPLSTREVSHNVGATLAVACPVSGNDNGPCASPWTNEEVKFTVSACARDSLNVCVADSAYSFTIRGSRRAA